jgi:hypothetical protein
MGTGYFPGVKLPGRGADPPPHLQCRGLKLGRAIPLPSLRALVACYRENLYLYLSKYSITANTPTGMCHIKLKKNMKENSVKCSQGINFSKLTLAEKKRIKNLGSVTPDLAVFVGPCHHVMASPQVADGGTASDMVGSCE